MQFIYNNCNNTAILSADSEGFNAKLTEILNGT